MAVALPIQLVVGDTGTYPCLITGGSIISAIFALVIDLSDDYSFSDGTISGPDGYTYSFSNNIYAEVIPGNTKKIVINIEEESPSPEETSHSVTFILPSKLTECFKAGRYSYDISVKQEDTTTSSDITARYTPIYTNAFNVFPKTNKIIIPQQNQNE